jgi:prepilin-type N-terminal cleavage/methylation domain-containing protein
MHSRGFTMIELLVVMTISAILVATAIPSFQWFIARNRASNASNDLLAALQLARAEAIRRGAPVSVCRTLNPNEPRATIACSGVADATYGANDWGSGYITFAKVAGTTNVQIEANDILIRRHQPIQVGAMHAFIVSNLDVDEVVSFNGNGFMNATPATPGDTPTFAIDYRKTSETGVENNLTGAGRCLSMAAGTGRAAAKLPSSGKC